MLQCKIIINLLLRQVFLLTVLLIMCLGVAYVFYSVACVKEQLGVRISTENEHDLLQVPLSAPPYVSIGFTQKCLCRFV